MSKKSTSFWRRRHFDELFSTWFPWTKNQLCFGAFLLQFKWKTDVTWAQIFWCDFERQKIVIVLISLFGKFLIYLKLKIFECPFGLNIVLMYFFKVIWFHLEIYWLIIQCLRTFTLAGTWSDLICLYLQGFLAKIAEKLQKNITGTLQRRRPFSVSQKQRRTSVGVFFFY